MIKKAIPHLFTLSNLLCGCLATFFTFSHQFNAALIAVFLGVFFDFFDGFFARLLKVESPLGVQLDSMADLITSGLVPGVLMYQLFSLSGVKTIDYTVTFLPDFPMVFSIAPLAVTGYVITLGAALRLARFNLISESLPYFKGLPAPANALMIMGLPLILRHPNLVQFDYILMNPFTLGIICFISVLLMNVDMRMFSLKFSGETNAFLFPLLIFMISIALLLVYGVTALSGIILIYIALNVVKNLFKI